MLLGSLSLLGGICACCVRESRLFCNYSTIVTVSVSRTVAYLISGIFVKVSCNVDLRHCETHIRVHETSACDGPRLFCARSSKRPIKRLSDRTVLFRHIRHSIHHKTPDEIILHGSRWRSRENCRCIAKKIQFADRDDVIVIQCHVCRRVDLSKVVGETELNQTEEIFLARRGSVIYIGIEGYGKITNSRANGFVLFSALFGGCVMKLDEGMICEDHRGIETDLGNFFFQIEDSVSILVDT